MQLPRVSAVVGARGRAAAPRPPTIPGVALCRALAADGTGPPWRGRDVTTGQDVVLRPLPASVPGEELTALPDHPHLAAVALFRDADGHPYTATALAAHGGLDAVLRRRGPLTAGETTMVVTAVGRALATLHAAGRVHGSVALRAVLVDGAMRPLLDGSLCRPVPVTEDDARRLAAEDVRALGAVAVECLGGDVPPALRAVVSAATDPMAGLRPDAVDLVRSAIQAVPPEGLRLTGHQHGLGLDERLEASTSRWPSGVLRWRAEPTDSPRRRHAGPRRSSSIPSGGLVRPGPVLVGVALLALAVGAGVVWARASEGDVILAPAHPSVTAVAPATAPPAQTDWSEVMRVLDLARAAAFANADTTVLSSVDAPGSPALVSDTTVVRALADGQLQAQGYAVTTSEVRVVSTAGSDARLDVVDVRGPYRVVDANGSSVASQPARPRQHWLVHLVRVGGTWLVHDVRVGPASGG
jgi:eukaryotic-like serine/threonine-protein kinase